MPQPYSSKSTPIIFLDAASALAWQRHIVDGAPADVCWTEDGYLVENQRAKESLSYAQLSDRFPLDARRIADAYARGFGY